MATPTTMQYTIDGTTLQLRVNGVEITGLGDGEALRMEARGGIYSSGGAVNIQPVKGPLDGSDGDENGLGDLAEVYTNALADAQADDPTFPALSAPQLRNLMRAINLRGVEKVLDKRQAQS